MENELPKGWGKITVGELCSLVYGKGLLTKNLIEKGFPVFGANGIIGYNKDFLYKQPKVIISCRGAASGAIHLTLPESFITSNSIVLDMNTEEISNKFLKYSMESVDRTKIVTGTAQPQITIENLKDLEIPIPPLAEQNRIVAKLDAILARVNNSKARLEKIPALLKNFRQSVLAAAVSGELTKEWRENEDINDGLPKTWQLKKATECCERIESGSTPKGKPFFEKEEIPYLKVYNIVNQKVAFDYKPQFIKREIHEKELKRCKVFPNDVIMNIVGPPLGKVAIIPNDYPEWNINQAIVLFRPQSFLSSKYLYYLLCDGKEIKAIENETRGSAGQSNISLTQCRNFTFPIPAFEEQEEIVRRVEELFHFADSIEARYQKAKAWFDKLPQSLLAKAFRGELVPQNENDEPASELLKRIKNEKLKNNNSASTKKKKLYKLDKDELSLVAEG